MQRTLCERGEKDLTPFLSQPPRIVYQLPPDALSVRSFCHTDIREVRRRAAFTCTPCKRSDACLIRTHMLRYGYIPS